MKVSQKIAAAAVSAAIVVGGTTAAFAAGDGSGSGSTGTGKSAKIAVLCEHKDQIIPTLTERQTDLTKRIAVLTELETKATTAGHTKAAARIEQRITKLQGRLDKVGTRLSKAPAWIAANCPAA